MAFAIAYEQAKTDPKQFRREGDGKMTAGGVMNTPFFVFDDKDMPHATLNKYDPGRFSSVHFHLRDQFQVIIDGKATLGRHNALPYAVHFSRAYTPYGPIRVDQTEGLTFFVMRAHRDSGAQRIPEKKALLDQVPDRKPYQITRVVGVPALPAAGSDYALQADPDMADERGLAAYGLNMKPNASVDVPDHSQTDGQYVVVVKGSLLHEGKEYQAPALIFARPNDPTVKVQAGASGTEALILNFPRPISGVSALQGKAGTNSGAHEWKCGLCSFVYDEAAGMPEEGVAPGTRWQDVPADWLCPDCSSPKSDFEKL